MDRAQRQLHSARSNLSRRSNMANSTRVTAHEQRRWLVAKLPAEFRAHPSDQCVDWPFGKNSGRLRLDLLRPSHGRSVSEVVLTLMVGPATCRHAGVPASPWCVTTPPASTHATCFWDTRRNNSLDRLLDGTSRSTLTARDAWEIGQPVGNRGVDLLATRSGVRRLLPDHQAQDRLELRQRSGNLTARSPTVRHQPRRPEGAGRRGGSGNHSAA